jgi:hypothetical protein
MSLFRTIDLACPACAASVAFEGVHSVNADRRPDLRAAILKNDFQRVVCPVCAAPFRLDPNFNYIDIKRGQWIAAAPVVELGRWQAREEASRQLFASAYGSGASELAQEIGRTLHPRLTFGWPALREKLLAHEHGLDDIAIEACKAVAMRSRADLPFGADADLRLVAVTDDRLVMGWVRSADNASGESLVVPRSLHDEIAADAGDEWRAFRDNFTGALFIDLNRLLVKQEA